MVVVQTPQGGVSYKDKPKIFIPPKPIIPPKRTTGGGGGSTIVVQQPKPIYDPSGKLVGVDTGTQSRLPTPADILIYGNKGGISSGITTPTTTTTTTPAIQEMAKQQEIITKSQELSAIQRNIQATNLALNLQTQSRYSDVFMPKAQISRLETQQKSVLPVSRKEIDIAVKEGKITKEQAISASVYSLSQDIINQYNRQSTNAKNDIINTSQSDYINSIQPFIDKRNDLLIDLQNKVNEGYSIDEANKQLSNFDKDLEEKNKQLLELTNKKAEEKLKEWNNNWLETTGKSNDKTVKQYVAWKSLQYRLSETENLKKQAKEFISNVKTGAIVGSGTVGAIKGLGFLPTSITSKIMSIPILGSGLRGAGALAGKVTGMGLFATQYAYQTTKYAISRGTIEKRYIDEGFSKEEAKQLAKAESGINFIQGQVSTGGFMVGALGAGALINYASNIGKLSIKEQELARTALAKNPESIKLIPQQGRIKESQIRLMLKENPDAQVKVLEGGQEVNKLVKDLRVGEIIRYSKIGLDPSRLNPQEIKVMNKLMKSIKGYQVTATQTSEGLFVQESFGTLKVPKIREVKISIAKGKIQESGLFKGQRVTQTYERPIKLKDRFFRVGEQPSVIKTREFSQIAGKGEIKQQGLFRAEQTKFLEQRYRQDIFKKGLWESSNIERPIIKGKSQFISKQKGIELDIINRGKIIGLRKTNIFGDVIGKEEARVFNILKFTKKPLPIKPVTPVEKSIFTTIPPPKVSPQLSNLIDYTQVTPSMVGGEGGEQAQSLYAFQKTKLALTPYIPEPTLWNLREVGLGSISSLSKRIIKPIVFPSLGLETEKAFVSGAIKPKLREDIRLFPMALSTGGVSERVITPSRVSIFQPQPQTISKAQLQQQKLSSSLIQIHPITPTAFRPFTPTPTPPTPFIPFLPFLGRVETGGGQRGKEEKISSLFSGKYTPSLGAVLLKAPKKKVTQKEYEELAKVKYSGLGLRPEIELKSKKRKGLF